MTIPSFHPGCLVSLRIIPLYFVTFCAHQRRKILATDAIHNAFREFARRAHAQCHAAVGRYVIMPDHLHLFVRGPDDFRLGQWVGTLKQHLARSIVGTEALSPIWQRGFFDHLVRRNESYGQKWNYVRENPIRAGLARRAEDWPYAGEIIVINRA
jgi:putative transposase